MHASRLVSSPGLEGLRRLSRRAWWLHALLIGQLALLPCPLSRGVWVEVDTDGDGLVDSGYEDGVSEGFAEEAQALVEPDADGDGLSDTEEAALGSDACNPDSDSDGLTDADEAWLSDSDPLSADSDGDGISDYNAFYGNAAVDTLWAGEGVTAYDWDGDGLHDPVDPDPYSAENVGDADGDHVPDPEDSHPLDPMLWCDWNGSGVNDDAEVSGADLDGDGVSDATDSHPADPGLDNDWNDNGVDDEHEDGDGDGVSNLQDSHPNANTLWCDWNGNGVNDDAEAAVAAGHAIAGSADPEGSEGADPNAAMLQDRDGDGYRDDHDSHPDDPGLWNDHDGNGLNDDTEAPPDTDRDGVADAWDAAPADQDNDGLTDTEEWTMGTDPAEADSDGDGLGDGEEVHAGTDPFSVDTDGDGLTDSEELFAYHSDPLEPTAITLAESVSPPEAGDTLPAGASGLRVSHLIPDPGSETGQRRAEHADGGSLVFPSRSAHKDKSDLTKTLLLAWAGEAPLAGVSARLSGADAAHFQVGPLSSEDLAPGIERGFSITFLAPAASTSVRTATLTFHGGPEAAPLFVLNLRSVVSAGLWTTNDHYFFADYTDSDGDGIPDLVEAMYAPLTVTATGDLDGDGTSNLDQYLAGRDLRAHAKSNDVDGDGLTNATEDAWNAAYPGRLNKYYFADAFADPDGDGLLTLEELTCTWGGQKDPHAVATHPFVAGSAPPSAGKTAHFRTTHRKPPRTAPAAEAATTASGPLLSRCSLYTGWMNDGQLRRASHETARANGGKLPADFFTPERVVHATTTALQTLQGSDHLPRGYLAWLGQQTPAITLPAPVPAMPESELLQSQLLGLQLPDASDADADALPTAWEAAYALNWRSAADSHLDHALETLNQRLASLAADPADPIQSAEQEAVAEVRNRLLAAQTNWPIITYPAMVQGQPTTVQTQLVPVYAVELVKFPPSLSASAAADATRRSAWIAQYTAALDWQLRSGLDPDHDGLMNRDEYPLGLSPRLPDYEATGDRDSDGDGFINAIEMATGTDHLNSRKRPAYAIEILTPVKERTGTTLQPLALLVQTVLRGPKGSWPLGSQSLSATAPDTQCLLAWGQDGAALDWHPKSVSAGVTNEQGRITLHVHPGWKKGGLRLTFRSTPGTGLPAGLRTATAIGSLTLTAPAEDSDTDGMPDVWEARPAQGPGDPAHALSKTSALDAEAGPQHFGYHPSTPAERLPATVVELLNEWKAAEADLGYLPEYPAMTAALTPLAVPTTADALTLARHKILALIDPDHDGWSNRVEFENGTHPQVPDNPATATRDTDGDGVADVLERQEGTNPFDAGSLPVLSLTDASLRVVWGSGQSAAPGSLAPQPVVVQVTRANGVLLKRVALEANCPGGHFAVPAVKGKNVQWQSGTLKLMTDAQGKASFHFWTPAGAASPWQIQVALASHPGIAARVTILNAGGSSSGASGGSTAGPGVADRKPNTGDSPGFSNSHAPFVIRFVDWKGGCISHEKEGGIFASGYEPYKARIQMKRWDLLFGTPVVVNEGPAILQDIGNHTTESAEVWQRSQSQATPSFLLKEYGKEWFGSEDGGGTGSAFYVLFEEQPDIAARRLLGRFKLANWSDAADYAAYEVPATGYELPGANLWQVVEAVWPAAEQDPGQLDPNDPENKGVKHYYQHMAPETFSHVEEMGMDMRRQSVELTGSQDVEDRFRELGVILPIAEKRLPNTINDESAGEVASALSSISRMMTEENERAYTAMKTTGKVLIQWDSKYPVSLSESSREAWLKRILVVRTERIRHIGVAEPVVKTHATPLNQLLSLSASQAATLDLDAGPLEEGIEKTVTVSLQAWDLAIDANRDGNIAQGETASEEKPFRFWTNDDHDSSKNDGEDVKGDKDNADNVIANERDLEDFQLLHFTIPESLLKVANQGKAHIGLIWRSTSGTTPSVRIYRAREGIQSPNDYIWNSKNAELQVQGSRYRNAVATVAGLAGVVLPRDLIFYSSDGFGFTGDPYLLLEGVTSGCGQLCLVIRMEDGTIIEGPGPWLNLCGIKKMYVRNSESQFEPPPAGTETQEVITFVHGWNMSPEGAAVFAETLFKRLWHKGFRGRFAAFRWNTDWSDAFDNVPGVGEPVEAYLADYNGSELIAWNSGLALKNFVNRRPASYRSMLVAHSMGNIVAGSALAQGLSIDKYVLLQAAVPASCYDDRVELKESETRKHNIPWLPDPIMWDEWTPDDDYDPEAYRGKLLHIGGEPTNFFQSEDAATSYAWEINNDLIKPPGVLSGRHAYLKYRSPGKRCLYIISDRQEGFHKEYELHEFEALTKACRSWSKAVGAQGKTRGAIKSFINNNDFGFDDEHSAEFNFPIQPCNSFYEKLTTELNISRP